MVKVKEAYELGILNKLVAAEGIVDSEKLTSLYYEKRSFGS